MRGSANRHAKRCASRCICRITALVQLIHTMVGKGRYPKSFREVWHETVLARRARGLAAVSSDLQPFLNKTVFPQSGERLPDSIIEAVRCREILDAGVWEQTRSRLLIVLALLSIFAIFVASDVMPTLRKGLNGYWVSVGVVAVTVVIVAVVAVWLMRVRHYQSSLYVDPPGSNARLANHVAALHLLYVSHTGAQATQSELDAQCGSTAAQVGGAKAEWCIHTVTVCGSRYLVMQNGRIFIDR